MDNPGQGLCQRAPSKLGFDWCENFTVSPSFTTDVRAPIFLFTVTSTSPLSMNVHHPTQPVLIRMEQLFDRRLARDVQFHVGLSDSLTQGQS